MNNLILDRSPASDSGQIKGKKKNEGTQLPWIG